MTNTTSDVSTLGAAPTAAAPSVLWKAFDVLGAFDRSQRVLTLAQISRRSGLPKSTVHRVLAMLLDIGALEQLDCGYRIGLRMFSLGSLPPEAALREAALVHLEEVHRYTGQTLHLAVLRGDDVIYLEKLSTRKSLATPATVGSALPASCTGVGKALLAFSDDSPRNEQLVRRTARSLATPDALADEIATIRRVGYAVDNQECAEGISCIGVPILVHGRAIAAVSVAFPAHAGNGSVLVDPLRQAATAIARSPGLLSNDLLANTG